MSSSDTDKVCAVVVPQSVEKCHDILSASSNLVKHTPCPFGLSIHAFDDDQSSRMSPQPLIYVSEQAARDRDPEKHDMNGMGVHAGWYLIARPGRFNVHSSRVSQGHYGLPWEDALALELEVDGQSTNEGKVCNQSKTTSSTITPDYMFEGYVEEVIPSSSRSHNVRRKIRPFLFESASNGSEGKIIGSTDVGTIKLKVKAGVLEFAYLTEGASLCYSISGKQVTAKAIAREGCALKVSHKHPTESQEVCYSKYRVIDRRNLPEAEITIFVRERSWLRSRRLINDDDQPITYGVFRMLLREAETSARLAQSVHEIVSDDEEPSKKKPKIKAEMVLKDDVAPVEKGEIIDLT